MEFLKELLFVFRVFQFCGFAPFPIPFDENMPITSNNQRKWYIYNGIVILYFSSVILHNIISYQIFLDGNKAEMLTYLSFITISVVRILAVIIEIESLLFSKNNIDFLKQINVMDRIFHEELGFKLNYKRMRRIAYSWLTVWVIQIIILIALVFIGLVKENIDGWQKLLWLILTVPLIGCAMRYFQIIYYIRLLAFHFEMINTQLETIHAKANRLSFGNKILGDNNSTKNSTHSSVYNEIVSLRRIFHILWECTGLLNNIFRWSLLFLVGTSLIIIVVNFYRILVWLLIKTDHDNIETIILYTFWFFIHTFYLIQLSSTCYYVYEEVNNIRL